MGTRLYKVSVVVLPKGEILDPQGKAVVGALRSLGFSEVADGRVGKVVRLAIEGQDGDPDAVRARATRMASALLANPVTEDFTVVVE